MTPILAGTKHVLDAPHTETIEVDESTGTLFHHVIHPDGTVAHEMSRKLSPEQQAQYLSHVTHWQARNCNTTDYTDRQHEARAGLYAKHLGMYLPRPQARLAAPKEEQ